MTTATSADMRILADHKPLGFPEFVVIIAAIMALNPMAMDMMLPAMPNIGAALNVSNPNHVQIVLSIYMLGFGVGQALIGPFTDRFGRRTILLGGFVLYVVASVLAMMAPTFETLLMARLLQGTATSATRVVSTAMVRDCYTGRRMASVMSLAATTFLIVPVLAPSLGQLILKFTEWRGLFVALCIYGVVMLLWIALRVPETLNKSDRKPINARTIFANYRLAITTRQTLGYALASGGVQGILFAYIFISQQVFVGIYGLGEMFPLAFATIAIGLAISGILNAKLVGRYGMRFFSHGALIGSIVIASMMVLAAIFGWLTLPVFIILSALTMFTFGLMFSNFTALALEPVGHIAGTASSLFGSVTTLIGIAIGYIIGQCFNGTMMPFVIGFLLSTLASLVVVLIVERGKLFRGSTARA